jgi:hypothetical protein
MRLTWKDGASVPFVGAAAALVAATGVFGRQRLSVLEAPAGGRDAVTHTR